jgi:hypothetical protein
MNTPTTTWPGPNVIQPGIERPTAMRLAETEYQRVTAAVDALRPEDWTRPGVGSAPAGGTHRRPGKPFLNPFEVARQTRAATAAQQPGQAGVDALTALQVEERQHLGPEELRAELHRVGPPGARGRRRIPGFIRRRRASGAAVVNGVAETWSLAYVTDVILTRDPWMHRLDLARATGQDPVHTADHDAVIVADVVAEWPAATASPTDSNSPALPAEAGPAAPVVKRS